VSPRKLAQIGLDFGAESHRVSCEYWQPTETKWRVWLRGVDLNHRPLGYEFNGKLIQNNLHAHG